MMKNKLFVLLTAVIICLLAVVPAAAFEADDSTPGFTPVERTLGLVVDYADVLTPQEESELEARLSALGIENKLEIGVITVDSYEGKSPQGFADDFYDYNGYGYGENDDGFIIVFNTGRGDGNRNIALSTHGKAIQLVNDNEMNNMFDVMIPWLTAEEFAIAFDVFVDESEKAIDISDDGKVEADTTTSNQPEDTSAEPEDTSAEPEDTSAEPEDTSAEPEDTSAEPEDTQANIGGKADGNVGGTGGIED